MRPSHRRIEHADRGSQTDLTASQGHGGIAMEAEQRLEIFEQSARDE
jgi:hypothetical protein